MAFPVVLVLSAAGSLALGATWTEIDAGLPRTPVGVRTVVVDPSSPSTTYAIAAQGSLFKSTNEGGTWNAIRGIPHEYVSSLVVDPGNSSTLYAVTDTVAKSVDGGQSWTRTGFAQAVLALAIDPRNTSTLYAMSNSAIFKTTDGGASWSPKTTGLPGLLYGGYFAIDPSNPSTLFAAVGTGLYKSMDGGESWRGPMVRGGGCHCPVAIDPANPSIVYAVLLTPGDFGMGGVPANLFKSTDGGENWKNISADIPWVMNSLAVDAASTVYVSYVAFPFTAGSSTPSTTYGVAKSRNGGVSWTSINAGLPAQIYSLTLNPANPSTIFASYVENSTGSGGVFRTVNGGANWADSSRGLAALEIHALAVDPLNPAILYAAVDDGVSKTIDGGADWSIARFPSPYLGTAIVPSLLIDPNNPSVLYAGVEATGGCSSWDPVLRKSTDGGATWNDLSITWCADVSAIPLAMDPRNSNAVFAAPGGYECGTPLDSTSDGGASWSQISGFYSVTAIAVAPGNPSKLYVVADGGLLRTTDNGRTWVSTKLTDVSVIALDPKNSNIVYAGTSTSLFKTTDGGETWLPINQDLAGIFTPILPPDASITALVIDPKRAVLYLGTSGAGVLRSGDGGRIWIAINDGLPSLDIRALAVTSDASGTIYAATSEGVFKTVDKQEGSHRGRDRADPQS